MSGCWMVGKGLFIDEAKIFVKAGDGGRGCISFRREKFVPRGGPDGGGGGCGGSVIISASHHLNTLVNFLRKKHFKAGKGGYGQGSNKQGKDGRDVIVEVPQGTLVYNNLTHELLADLIKDGQRIVVAEGGRGGRGNASFATSTRQAPRIAQPGEQGEEHTIRLELKLLADVGLVGFPNAGKSTFISLVSAARPKIADYPFTTLEPCLGTVRLDEEISFVIADIPGLIEGASQGKGLGQKFLAHIERTRLLVHILDVSEGKDHLVGVKTINQELRLYSPKLPKLPLVLAINKVDLKDVRERLPAVMEILESQGYFAYPISALTGEGVREILFVIAKRLTDINQNLK